MGLGVEVVVVVVLLVDGCLRVIPDVVLLLFGGEVLEGGRREVTI